MKKIIMMLILVLTMTISSYGRNPITDYKIENDSIQYVYVSIPSKITFGNYSEDDSSNIRIRLIGEAKEKIDTNDILIRDINNNLYITLKNFKFNYKMEDLNNWKDQIRIYMPEDYYDKIKVNNLYSIHKTISDKKNDSGNSTN